MEEEPVEAVAVDASSKEVKFEKMDGSKISTTSDYAQVIFINVAKMYPIDAHIECRYNITASLQPNKWDWVGLYKVGWMSPKDKVHYEWAVMPDQYEIGHQRECSVLFQSYNLPKDDGEFYQFCYINSSGQVRGASTPFQFQRPGADDFVECEDEDLDMMVICSKTSMLQDAVEKLEVQNTELVETQKALNADRESILCKLVEADKLLTEKKQSKQELDNKLKEHEDAIDLLHKEASDMGHVHDMLKDKVDKLTKEKEELNIQLQDKDAQIKALEGEVRSMRNTVDQITGRVNMLDDEKELFKNHFTTSEEKIVAFQTEIENLKKQLSANETLTCQQRDEIRNLTASLEKERKRLARQASISESDKETIISLTERYQNATDKLVTMEGCKAMLNEQLQALQEAHDQMSSSMEKAKTEAHSLKIRLAKTEEKQKKEAEKSQIENAELKAKFEKVEEEKEQLVTRVNEMQESSCNTEKVQEGTMFAMREAYNSLKEQNTELVKKYNNAKIEQKEAMKMAQRGFVNREMKRENEDLRERLDMAKEEYIQLYQKQRRTQLVLEKNRRSAETESVQRTSVSEQTDSSSQCVSETREASTESNLDELSNVELQTQLDDLASELEQRRAKKNKYKKQLTEEREKNQMLQAHYQQEYSKFQAEKQALLAKLEAFTKESPVDEVILEQPRYPNPYQAELRQVICTKAPAQIVYPQEGVRPKQPIESKFVNPYTCSKGAPPPTYLPKPNFDEQTQCSDGEESPLECNASPAALEEPLTPLPAPLQPHVLPSAKLAAVKHAVGLGNSSSESSVHEVHVDIQELETHLLAGKRDVDQGSVKEVPAPVSAPPSAPPPEDIDDDTDRFHDAEGEPQRSCPVCNKTFSLDCPEKQVSAHINHHFVYCCPMCNKEFDKEATTEEEFERHVQNHLRYT